MSEIKMFRLVSGEFVIGECENSVNGIDIKSPLVINFQPQPNGQLGLRMFPLNPFGTKIDESIPIKSKDIMFLVDPIQNEIKNEFIRITSGITVAHNVPELKVVKQS